MIIRVRRLLSLALVSLLGGIVQVASAAAGEPGQASAAPAGIAVDPDGNVYVTDYAADRVVKFGPDGTVLLQWGGTGSGQGQFNGPFGVCLEERGAVYVVDQLNARVQKFTADGTWLSAWGSPGAAHGDLRTPFGVASAGGRIYVADFGNDRVQLFGADGASLSVIGERGSNDGQLSRPAGIALDRDGNVYVSDHFNDRVQKFGPDGHFQSILGAPAAALNGPTPLADGQLRRPEGVAVDHDGNVWVADYGRDRVAKFGSDGHFILAVGGRGSAQGEFVGPKGVALDPTSGHVFVADTGNGRIQRLAPDGTPELVWSLPTS